MGRRNGRAVVERVLRHVPIRTVTDTTGLLAPALLTMSERQCAAVRIAVGEMSVPPQM